MANSYMISAGRAAFIAISLAASIAAGPQNRIIKRIDSARTHSLPGHIHSLAMTEYDRGPVDPALPVNYVLLALKPSAAQQADLEQLLADQQNPSSPNFHKWLTPEQFGARFGASVSDQSKLVAWLTTEGFKIERLARSRNWIAFSGTAGQISKSFRTSLHRFEVNGKTHFANVTEPAVPEALADIVDGLAGLNNFGLQSFAIPAGAPNFTSGTSHFIAPDDFATIYNVAPLYAAGIDGTGQSIAVVGDSDILVSDVRTFRQRVGLPANDPRLTPYSIADPGFNGDQIEGNLDVQVSGAIAPKATIFYVYGPSVLSAIILGIELNVAPIMSVSYGGCETNFSPPFYRAITQQGNAQGITILVATGDAGAAGCDRQGSEPLATRGLSTQWPAAIPEVTGVGGTQFNEGTGTFWGPTNNATTLGSALGYIPEIAWNENSTGGLGSGGGGTSRLYPRPAWQAGPGVPAENFRHVPDVSLSGAVHDAYLIVYQGSLVAVGGTSASAPAMAGIVALLNQYQISKGFQKTPGLGNINPQLYRLAKSAPDIFHDIVDGSNSVPCAQGTPDCLNGTLGYKTGVGYDRATGLGSFDANKLVTQWNTVTNGVTVTLSGNITRGTLNDTVQLTVTVAASTGTGTPTGTVDFSSNTLPLGRANLANGSATLSLPLAGLQVLGTTVIAAQYSGDAAFSAGGATLPITITSPTGVAGILLTGPTQVFSGSGDAQGLSWPTILTVRETSGVPAIITNFTIDGTEQTVSDYFSSPNIQPLGTATANFVVRRITPPLARVYGIKGVDVTGQTFSRQITVNYLVVPGYNFANVTATPLVITQNPNADPSCQWATQLNVDDEGGFGINIVSGLFAGDATLTSSVPAIFGSTRLDAYGGLQGRLCFGNVKVPSSDTIEVALNNGFSQQLTVSFAPAPANAGKMTVNPANVVLNSASVSQPATKTIALTMADKSHSWTASVFPANRTTGWLSLSQLTGTGSGQITLTANGTGYGPGAYRATIVLESPNTTPQTVSISVMFVFGPSDSGISITGVGNAASGNAVGASGGLLSVFGTKLSDTTQIASASPLAYTMGNVTATVNNLGAPITYASSGQINLQIPYAAGAGPAVVSINNNGQVAGFQFTIAPAAPGVFVDAINTVVPSPFVTRGGFLTLYMTGAGDVSPAIKTAFAPSTATPVGSLPKPLIPVSATVGGTPAFVQFAGIPATSIGVVQVNLQIPASTPLGFQNLVITMNGVQSPPVGVIVQAPSSAGDSGANAIHLQR